MKTFSLNASGIDRAANQTMGFRETQLQAGMIPLVTNQSTAFINPDWTGPRAAIALYISGLDRFCGRDGLAGGFGIQPFACYERLSNMTDDQCTALAETLFAAADREAMECFWRRLAR